MLLVDVFFVFKLLEEETIPSSRTETDIFVAQKHKSCLLPSTETHSNNGK